MMTKPIQLPSMTKNEVPLIDLLYYVENLKTRLRRLDVPVAAPPVVYEKIDELNLALTNWAMECVTLERGETNADDK
jgi:hypothetical protein